MPARGGRTSSIVRVDLALGATAAYPARTGSGRIHVVYQRIDFLLVAQHQPKALSVLERLSAALPSSCSPPRRGVRNRVLTRAGDDRSHRRNAMDAAALFPRPQPNRALSSQKGRRSFNPWSLGSHWNNPPKLHSARMQKLLHTPRIWVKLRGIRSKYRSYAAIGRGECG
jgi:hypothetical protein